MRLQEVIYFNKLPVFKLVLAQRLELHAKSLSEAHNEDKKHIQKLERELMNCSQEIGAHSYFLFHLPVYSVC